MKINLQEFERVLNKTSVGYSLDFVQLLISPTQIKSSLALQSKALVTILTLENTFLEGMKPDDIFEMNFNNPNIEIVPYLKLFSIEKIDCVLNKGIKGEISSIKVHEKETKMTAQWNLALVSSTKVFNNPTFANGLSFFTEIVVTDDFVKKIHALKKIAYATNKLYFTTQEKTLNIETGDKKQKHINSFKIELQKISEELTKFFDSISICLDAKLFISVIDQISSDGTFKIKLAYKPEKKIGMVCITNDTSETYIIPQIIEIDNLK